MTTFADDLLSDFERRLAALEPGKAEPRKEAAPPPPKSPAAWTFWPIRDQDNLIIRIDARPTDG